MFTKINIVILFFLMIILAALGGINYFIWHANKKIINPNRNQEFVITKGESVKKIGKNLQDKGLVDNLFIFEKDVWLKGSDKNFIAGTYTFPEQNSITDIISILTAKAKKEQVVITIQEGLSNVEISKIWEGKKMGSAVDFLAKADVTDSRVILPNNKYDFFESKPKDATLEGYLYPDTYYLYKDAKPEDLIEKMLNNFETKTKEIRDKIKQSGKNLHKILILSSIVEREVPKNSERPIIAGIFTNRLDIGMALQSDATVNYVTGKYRLQPTFEDLKVASPYNTYRQRGLPPGPIGNPSLSSISASFNPASTDFFYFLSKPNGETVFSKTLDEHNTNKAKYLK